MHERSGAILRSMHLKPGVQGFGTTRLLVCEEQHDACSGLGHVDACSKTAVRRVLAREHMEWLGTTVDMFLRENMEWLSRATNWAKFSATAGLGVIHRHGRSCLRQKQIVRMEARARASECLTKCTWFRVMLPLLKATLFKFNSVLESDPVWLQVHKGSCNARSTRVLINFEFIGLLLGFLKLLLLLELSFLPNAICCSSASWLLSY
eukprot:1139474-Pelagomonas_calceolata.AAC.5